MAWNIHVSVAQSGAAAWNGLQTRSSYPGLATWGVIFHVDPGAAIEWNVLTYVLVSSAGIQWNIGQPQQGDMRLATMDEWFTPE
jgi:hypothetical protein